jgi:hypothetical protein
MAHMAVCGCRMSDVEGNGLGIDYVIHTLRHAFHFRVKGQRGGGARRGCDRVIIILSSSSLDLYIATPSLINHNVTSIHCLAIILSKSGNTVPIPLTTMTLDLPSESRYQPPPTDSRDRSITTRDLMEGDGRIHNSLAFALRGSIASKLRTP